MLQLHTERSLPSWYSSNTGETISTDTPACVFLTQIKHSWLFGLHAFIAC